MSITDKCILQGECDISKKCGIARALITAAANAKCSGAQGALKPLTEPICELSSLMNYRDYLFQLKYSPASWLESDLVRSREIENVEKAIASKRLALMQAFPGADPSLFDLTWAQAQNCRWNADGSPGGPYQNEYFSRLDLMNAGYTPQPLSGKLLAGVVPLRFTQYLPVWPDAIVSPSLLVILLLLIYVITLALVWRASKRAKKGGVAPATRGQSAFTA